jgi:hypothetical protein
LWERSLKSEVRSSFSPKGSVDSAETITIVFDKPVVPASMVAKDAGNVWSAKPAFPAKAYWHDTKTLVIDPEKLASSTKYEVKLEGDLATKSGKFKLDFVHDPLAVEGVWGVDPEMLAPDGTLPLSFNQPVIATSAAKHCKLTGVEGAIELSAAPSTAEPLSNVALILGTKLQPGGAYTLTCEGLVGAGGNAPLASPYSLTLRARPLLSVVSMLPAGQTCPPTKRRSCSRSRRP